MKRTLQFSATLILMLVAVSTAFSQDVYQPYSFDVYQQLGGSIYSVSTRAHTSLKPFLDHDSLFVRNYDSVINRNKIAGDKGGFYQKLFNQHQIDFNNGTNSFYADFLPDFVAGKNLAGAHESTSLTAYGFQVGGSVDHRLVYNFTGFENEETFPEYLSTYIHQTGNIPGEAALTPSGKSTFNWAYYTANVSYTPVKYLNITLGRDKNFIGDGYRSLFLSDYASPYPFLKLTATLGNVQYTCMWAYMNDPTDLDSLGHHQTKWGAFHYLDWNVTNRLSLGFYDSVIWPNRDNAGHYRGFDFEYIQPIVFLRPVEASSGSPDNALIGFTAKYKLTNGIMAYGQFMLDEFEAKNFFSDNGSSRNKNGWQLGIRGADMFGIKGLGYLLEGNNVKPYTYSERSPIENYTENGEPLAHPWGANFREVVGLLNYNYKRFQFAGEGDFGYYGLDENGLNYGKDPFEDYTQPAKTLGNYMGQGLTTHLYYMDARAAYLINPKYNLRLELEGTYRLEQNTQFTDRALLVSIGLRSSFRKMYTDLASFKSH